MQWQCCAPMANHRWIKTTRFIKIGQNKTKTCKHRTDMSIFWVRKMGIYAFLKHDTIMLSFFYVFYYKQICYFLKKLCTRVKKILRNGQKRCPKMSTPLPFWEKTRGAR